jgi:hypothetical protein
MFQVIHHTSAVIAVELREAIAKHLAVPLHCLQSAIDWSNSTPDNHAYAIFFDRVECSQSYAAQMAQPPGDETIQLPQEPPTPFVLNLFIRAFEHGYKMLGKAPSIEMIDMFFDGYNAGRKDT